MATKVEQYQGTGRRKTSVARVYLRPGTGSWEVNGRPLAEYLPRPSLQQHAQEPLVVADQQGRFDVKVTVDGGGHTGQAGAIRLALARALVSFDPDLRGVLRERGLLTRDAREVERKKPGQPGARKRFQFSKR
jgi:small subunit ribosomal protein S9